MQRRMMMIKWAHDTVRRRFMSTSAAAIDWWNHVDHAPKDPIMSVTEAFLSDTSPNKINLGVVGVLFSLWLLLVLLHQL